MRAVTYHGPRDIRVQDVPAPGPVPAGQVRLRPLYCGICGTDLHEYTDGPIVIPTTPHPLTGAVAPQVLGHEFSARVLEIGAGVDSVAPGVLVSVMPLISCGHCEPCRRAERHLCLTMACTGLSSPGGGGLADEVVVAADQVHPVPAGVTDLQAALVEPAAVAAHGVDRSGLRPGQSVFVAGGGPIGALAALYARASGAGRIVISEPNPARRDFLAGLGVADVVDPLAGDIVEAVHGLLGPRGMDVSIECSATAAGLGAAIALCAVGGTVSQVGLHVRPAFIDPMTLCQRSLRLEGIWCYPTTDWPRIMALIATGRFPVERVVSHEIALEDAVVGGFDELCRPSNAAVKILIRL
jgi:(R,R)-butanediol dehydrogenase / meso-butanediol dehydrogenase / diacetyl reductase